MQKLVVVLCIAIMPVLSWSAPQSVETKAVEKTKTIVAMTGVHSKSLQSIRSNIYTETIYSALMKIKGISVIPQATIAALNLEIEEDNDESIEKALEKLKADKIICYFVEQDQFEYKVDFYIFDGKSGEQLCIKSSKSKYTLPTLELLKSCLTETESILRKPGVPKNIAKPAPSFKPNTVHSETEFINLELSLYDFVDKKFNFSTMLRGNTFLVAANYKIFTPSKKLAVTFGPYFSENHGSDDLGIRTSGYFYPYPNNIVKFFPVISGAGFYSLNYKHFALSGEVKLGSEIPMGPIELFGEGGVGWQTDSIYVNLMINAGVRLYIF